MKLTNAFTAEEYATLQHYFIEQDLSDETFVASDVDAAISGNTTVLKDSKLSIANSKLARVDFSEVNKTMYTIAEGKVTLTTASELTADIIRGTLECKPDNTWYAQSLLRNDQSRRQNKSERSYHDLRPVF